MMLFVDDAFVKSDARSVVDASVQIRIGVEVPMVYPVGTVRLHAPVASDVVAETDGVEVPIAILSGMSAVIGVAPSSE